MRRLTVRIDGPPGSGKTTIASILYHLLQKAGYDVCLAGEPFRNEMIEASRLDALPTTYLRTQVDLIDGDSTPQIVNRRIPTIAVISSLTVSILIGVFFPFLISYVLTAMVSSGMAIAIYRTMFSR